MDLRRLRSFVAVAEQGTVLKAAVQLHLSQPGLSRQIQELQHELGLRLFEHVGRRLVLTPEGQQLLGSCREVLGQASAIKEQAQSLKRGDVGPLTVAASAIQIETSLSTFLPRYAKRYPHVQLKLIESSGPNTLAMLERGEIHLGIALVDAVEAEHRNFASYPVRPLELIAACHPDYPLPRGRAIDIGQIASHPLLVADMSFAARNKFDAICRVAGLKPNIRMESRAHHTKLALAEAGLGVAIISTTVQTHRYRLRTIRITYKNEPILEPLAVVWDKRRALPRYAQDFYESLAAHMLKLFPFDRRQPKRSRKG
ncbi:MAG: LysR family transcriptional regulator [Pseudomonadota bacterium]